MLCKWSESMVSTASVKCRSYFGRSPRQVTVSFVQPMSTWPSQWPAPVTCILHQPCFRMKRVFSRSLEPQIFSSYSPTQRFPSRMKSVEKTFFLLAPSFPDRVWCVPRKSVDICAKGFVQIRTGKRAMLFTIRFLCLLDFSAKITFFIILYFLPKNSFLNVFIRYLLFQTNLIPLSSLV